MKKGKISGKIRKILLSFFVEFGILVLIYYIWDGTVNIPRVLLFTVMLQIVDLAVIAPLERTMKKKSPENNEDKTE